MTTDDPFNLRRFGIYSEADIALTARVFYQEHSPPDAYWPPRSEAEPHSPSLDAFLAYWTPERIAAAKSSESSIR